MDARYSILTFALAASAFAAAAFVGEAGAEAPKGAIFSGKFEVSGKVDQSIAAGKNGEGYVLAYEEDVSAPGGSDHKVHCIGVMQGVTNKIVEQRGYCVETDPDGDQVLWKITPRAHEMGSSAVIAVHETIAGTGKYADASAKITTTCAVASAGPTGYALKCDQAH